jgi:hypothetical protein
MWSGKCGKRAESVLQVTLCHYDLGLEQRRGCQTIQHMLEFTHVQPLLERPHTI